MGRMYKYFELEKYFSLQERNNIQLTFEEIEDIIGFKLPKSAYVYSAYWHPSETHTICKSWTDNGYKMVHVELGNLVEFERTGA